jgi:hypothetical protein
MKLNTHIMEVLHQVSLIIFMVQKQHENVLRHVNQLPYASIGQRRRSNHDIQSRQHAISFPFLFVYIYILLEYCLISKNSMLQKIICLHLALDICTEVIPSLLVSFTQRLKKQNIVQLGLPSCVTLCCKA